MIGVGLSIVQLAVRQMLGGAFTPASIFANSEPGVWYDPSDLTTLFQDSAGTTPVTAVEQPVGRMLDKSGRGNHATQTTSTSRPVLSARYNLLTNTETLSTQSVTTQATDYKLRFTGTGTITLSGTKTGVYTAGTHTLTGVTAGTLTVTVAGVATTVDLRPANLSASLPAYQRVNTATDYDTTGFPKYLKFDGSDDWMETSSAVQVIPLNSSFTTFIGARKATTSPNAFVTIGTSARLHVLQETFASGATYIYTNGVDPSINASVASKPDDTLVATFIATIGQLIQYRRNGVLITVTQPSSLVARTGSGGLYIGRRETSSRFNGNIYSLIVRGGANLDTTTIEQTENWVNTKTLAY